jgi:uncharacterized protein YbjT (DUF2867 family)
MILIVGATGQLGTRITRALLAEGHPVLVLVREGSDDTALRTAGAGVARGDLRDRASLDEACSGTTTVVSTANSARRGGDDTVETVDQRYRRCQISRAAAQRHVVRQLHPDVRRPRVRPARCATKPPPHFSPPSAGGAELL